MAHSGMCEFYLRGDCRYGVKCWNRHGFEEEFRGQPYLNADTYRRSLQSSSKPLLYCIINLFYINTYQTLQVGKSQGLPPPPIRVFVCVCACACDVCHSLM